MSELSRFLFSSLVVIFFAGTPGCLARYRTNPVEVTVSNGNDRAPVVGARVRVEYPKRDLLTAPPATHGVTNEEGMVTLPIADIKTATLTVTSAKEEEDASFKETFQLNQELIRDGGALERDNVIQAASWNGSASLQLTLENRKWAPGFLDRFRKRPAETSSRTERESDPERE